MNETNKTIIAGINKWNYFCLNYKSDLVNIAGDEQTIAPTFFNAFPKGLRSHLYNKFCDIHNTYGAYSAVPHFYMELDSDNRRRLLDWFIENFKQDVNYGINLAD